METQNDLNLFSFILNSDKNSVSVALSSEFKGTIVNLTIPQECIIEGETYVVTKISDNAFSSCSKLKNVTIPKSIMYIGSSAFSYCENLESIIIPENVEYVGKKCFIGCSSLINVFVKSNQIILEENVFPLTNDSFIIYTSINSNLIQDEKLQPYVFLFKENNVFHNSHLFVAGVGDVELFSGTEMVLSSKTLIDTSINLTVTLEDIQSNGGAKLYGKYASQAAMTMRLTDAMFRMEFLAANIGADVELGGEAVVMENSIVENGVVKIIGTPRPLCKNINNKVVWIRQQEDPSNFLVCSEKNIKEGEGADFGKTLITDVPFPDNTQVCVKYIKEYEEGQTIKVSSNYLPEEMIAILTASLFSGDKNNLEKATKVGTLTITIPRLMLAGNVDISMSMSGHSQTNIEGQALAVEESECDEGGYYATISKVLENNSWTSNLAGIAIDNANHLKKFDFLNVFGVFYGMGIRPITNERFVVLPSNCVDENGMIVYDGDEDLLITIILKDDSNKITQGIIEVN